MSYTNAKEVLCREGLAPLPLVRVDALSSDAATLWLKQEWTDPEGQDPLRSIKRKPACLLFGGETTVTLRGDGLGGRNQEMALAMLEEMAAAPEALREVSVLCASTDGTDGPTDAAGAFASHESLLAADAKALHPPEYLRRNDSYHFFESLDCLFKSGPTNTNVCDIQIVLVPAES